MYDGSMLGKLGEVHNFQLSCRTSLKLIQHTHNVSLHTVFIFLIAMGISLGFQVLKLFLKVILINLFVIVQMERR